MKKKCKIKRKISIQKIFCIISILFIIGCFIFYGKRLIKYYKIYNPKIDGESTVYMATDILTNTSLVYEGNGAYRINGNTIYKGENVDNYVSFSNMLWRIIKIKSDNTIVMMLDDYINILPWNEEYTAFTKSDIFNYLNDIFIKSFNTEKLAKTTICEDDINSMTTISCSKMNLDNYISLLDISDYVNSIVDDKTFLSKENEKIWLANSSSAANKAWHTSSNTITLSKPNINYLVKPVITLANNNVLLSGTGTKENPYIVKEDIKDVRVSSYVKLDNDLYQVYDIEKDVIKLEATKLVTTSRYFSNNSNIYDENDTYSLAYYLNNTYYKELPYKDKLVKGKYYIGEYENSYKDALSKYTECYIGLLNISDLKFDSNLANYYLITPIDDGVYIYNSILAKSRIGVKRHIRPTISISKENKFKGNGTLNDPFILED